MEEPFDIRNNQNTEREFENALRPLSFHDFKGQEKIVENLKIFVAAARMRTESLDHVLLHGPPGLGKTTLSNIIANELNVLHVRGVSSRARPFFVEWHKHRGLWRYFRKFEAPRRSLPLRIGVWCAIWAHAAVQLPRLLLRR